MRWGRPESSEIDQYEALELDGASIFLHQAIKVTPNARIDAVTGGVGTKLILLGAGGSK